MLTDCSQFRYCFVTYIDYYYIYTDQLQGESKKIRSVNHENDNSDNSQFPGVSRAAKAATGHEQMVLHRPGQWAVYHRIQNGLIVNRSFKLMLQDCNNIALHCIYKADRPERGKENDLSRIERKTAARSQQLPAYVCFRSKTI